MNELVGLNQRIIFYGAGKPARNISNIRVSYEKGIQKTVEYLYLLGHRRIAFVDNHTGLAPSLDRHKPFIETMKR